MFNFDYFRKRNDLIIIFLFEIIKKMAPFHMNLQNQKINPSESAGNFTKKQINQSKNDLIPKKPKFESEDSEGSDMSYESSIESDEDLQLGQAQYFKEEMARFFINYPELVNNSIIDTESNLEIANNESKLNPNWSKIAEQILS
eukprot:GHVR01011047.1.p1 GENE.GHVR01011047.1~~GHVR01011047.1.p1  ORF type:complete len:144 (-),score=10.90 GHVR01011047.1:163-594(-)